MHPIITIFGPGNNGSTTLFRSVCSDHQELPSVPLEAGEEQRFNKFLLHTFDSLDQVLAAFPDRSHRIVYPVRCDLERQVISAFIRYAGKIEKRPHSLGLTPGRWKDWPARMVQEAFDEYVDRYEPLRQYGEFHRRLLRQFEIQPHPLAVQSMQIFRRDQADVLLIASEAVEESEAVLASFVNPARVSIVPGHRSSSERTALVKLLMPRAKQTLNAHIQELRAEFPAFYVGSTVEPRSGLWAQLCTLLHLPFRQAAVAA